jgi:hypothetical protein
MASRNGSPYLSSPASNTCRDLKHISNCPLLPSEVPVVITIVTTLARRRRPSRITLNPQMHLVLKQGSNRRRKNLLTSDEVATIIPDEYSDPGGHDTVLAERSGPTGDQPCCHRINVPCRLHPPTLRATLPARRLRLALSDTAPPWPPPPLAGSFNPAALLPFPP